MSDLRKIIFVAVISGMMLMLSALSFAAGAIQVAIISCVGWVLGLVHIEYHTEYWKIEDGETNKNNS